MYKGLLQYFDRERDYWPYLAAIMTLLKRILLLYHDGIPIASCIRLLLYVHLVVYLGLLYIIWDVTVEVVSELNGGTSDYRGCCTRRSGYGAVGLFLIAKVNQMHHFIRKGSLYFNQMFYPQTSVTKRIEHTYVKAE